MLLAGEQSIREVIPFPENRQRYGPNVRGARARAGPAIARARHPNQSPRLNEILWVMAAGTQISVEEYLHTAYRPDCDYVDGWWRSVTWESGIIAGFKGKSSYFFLSQLPQYRQSGIRALPEWRFQTKPTRFRNTRCCCYARQTGSADPDQTATALHKKFSRRKIEYLAPICEFKNTWISASLSCGSSIQPNAAYGFIAKMEWRRQDQ